MFANPQEHDCPHGIPQTHLLVKQETRGLANAIVVLDRPGEEVMPTRLSATLTSEGCQLLPRVQWVRQGTSLLVSTKDPATHPLKVYREDQTLFEIRIEPGGKPIRRPLVVAGLYTVDCLRHPWERAWIYVSPHDSVAVTDAEGRFQIKNVPPGKYRIMARHEGWEIDTTAKGSRLEYFPMEDPRRIKVRSGESTDILFDNLTPVLDLDRR